MNSKRIIITILAITLLGFVGGGFIEEPRSFNYLERLMMGLVGGVAFLLSYHGPELIALFKTNSQK